LRNELYRHLEAARELADRLYELDAAFAIDTAVSILLAHEQLRKVGRR
jgi:hypothetical protein